MNRVVIALISLLGVIVIIACLPLINSAMVAYLLFVAKITGPISYYTGMDGFLLLIAAAGLIPLFVGLVLYALFEEAMIRRRGNGLIVILISALLIGFVPTKAEAITPAGIRIQLKYDHANIASERDNLRSLREDACRLKDSDLHDWFDRKVALYSLQVEVLLGKYSPQKGEKKTKPGNLPPEWQVEYCKK